LKKLKGSIKCIRSKAKWVEEGEKPTNCFLNLENRNFVSKCKLVLKVKKDNGVHVIRSNQEEILDEIKQFYEKLYCNNENYEVEGVN